MQGRLTNVGIGKESTFDTAVSATTTLPAASMSVWERSTFEDAADLHQGGGGVTQRRAELARDVGGTLETLMSYETLGLCLEGGIGANATTGAGPYQHRMTHVDQALLPSYTLRGRLGNTSHVFVMTGCVVSQLKLSWKAREFCKLTVDYIGRQMTSFGAGTPGTPTIGALCLPHQVGTFTWNSATYADITEVELIVNNNLARTPRLGSKYTDYPEPTGRRTVRCKVTARLTAAEYATLQAATVNETISNFTFTFIGAAARAIGITVHNAQIVETPEGPLTQQGPILVSWMFAATDDGSGTDGLQLDYTNNNATYSA